MKGIGGNVTVEHAWAHALDTSEDGKLHSQIGMVFGLPREIQKQLQRLPDYDVPEMAWWKPLSRGLMHYGLREPWNNAVAAITPDIIGAVRARAKKLSVYSPESILEDSVIQELWQQIEQIREAMGNETDANEDLVEFLSQRLTHMEDLLDDIKIVGAVGVRHNVETVIKEVVDKAEDMEKEFGPQTWEYWKRFIKRTVVVCGAITVISGTPAAVRDNILALTSGVPQIENPQDHIVEPHKEPPSVRDEDKPTDAEFKTLTDSI